MAGTFKECGGDGDGGVRGGGSLSTLSPDLMRKEDSFEFCCRCEDGKAGGCLALFGQTCHETDTHTVDQNKR